MDGRASLAARARYARTVARDVPSPCSSVCSMNPASGLCIGCLRTLDEIAAWSVLEDAGKRVVWALIEQRAKGDSS